MTKFIALSLLYLGITSTLMSQNITDRIRKVLDLYDSIPAFNYDHEKNYHLKLYSNQWINLLQQPDFDFPVAEQHVMKKIESPDRFITLYYMITPLKNLSQKIDAFAVYTRDSLRRVIYTQEQISILTSDKHTDKQLSNLQITTNKRDTTLFYELAYLDQSNSNTNEKGIDLYTKCLFEEMALSKNNIEKETINAEILSRMELLWKEPTLFEDPFKELNRMSTLLSNDKKVKICTWNIEHSNATHTFYGAVITQKESGTISVFPLLDKTKELKNPDRLTLNHKKWFGAIYFDIIETKYKKQTYYTLIGFKGNSELTKMKLLETLTILPSGEPRFGSSILAKGPGFMPRLIFEYSAGTNMMMRYNPDHKMIVVDNLSPSEPMFKDVYRFYGPDFSYNGYKFEKGKWVIYPDIDIRNPKTDKPITKKTRTSKIPEPLQK